MKKQYCEICGSELFLILETTPVSGLCVPCNRYQTWEVDEDKLESRGGLEPPWMGLQPIT